METGTLYFRFAIDSELLAPQLFAAKYLGLLISDLRTINLEFVEFYVQAGNSLDYYKLGQIMACATRDFQALAEKYRTRTPDAVLQLEDPED